MTGSVAGSTGLTALVGSGSGNFRYNSDEVTTNYSTALGAGKYAIYREAPSATINMSNDVKTYNGLAYTGGNGYTLSTGGVNGDTATQVGANTVYGGTAQNAKYAGSYTLTGSSASSPLGYSLNYVDGTLTLNKADLTVTANAVTKTYDGTLTATGSGTVGTLAGSGDSVNAAGSQAFTDKNYGIANKTVKASGVTVKDASNADMTANYNIKYVDNTTSTINKAALSASLTGTVEKEYDGTTSASNLTNSNYAVTGWVTVNGITEGASVTQTSGTYSDKNVPNNSGTGLVSTTLASNQFTADSGTDLGNYSLPTTAFGSVGKITPAALEVKVNNASTFVTLDPNKAVDNGISYTGFKNGETAATALTGIGTRTYSGASTPVTGKDRKSVV
jgi:hypothetical protein